MNEEEIANLVTKLTADSADYTSGMEEATKTAKSAATDIEDSFNKVGAGTIAAGQLIASAVTAIASKVYEFGQSAVSNFAEAEAGAIKLKAAIGARGGDVEKTFKDYDEFAASIQRLTVVDDDAVKSLLQQSEALGVTGDAAKRAAKNAVALQAARGISAHAAIRMTAALEQGNAQMLTRMLPSLRTAKTDTDKLAMAHDLLGKMFKVAEAEAGSIKGAYAQMGNAMGDTMEMVGEFVSQNLGLVTAMQFVRDSFVTVQQILPAVFERVQPLLSRVKEMGGEVWEFISTSASNFVSFVEPLIYQWANVTMSLWEAVGSVAIQAFQLIQDTVTSVWNFLTGATSTTWGDIKTFMLEAMIAGEFAIRNFDDVAALTWINVQLGFVEMAEDIKHFFFTTIPELLSWFGQNWHKVFFAAFDLATTVFINLGQNIRNAMSAIWDFIASGGTKKLEFAWTPLTEGFVNAIDKLPELSKRGLTDVEKQLAAESASLAQSMGEEFEEFHAQRMGEINSDGLISSLLESKDVMGEAALDIGESTGKALGKGMKDGVKIEGAAVGSADAMARILATQEALRAGKITASVSSGPGTAVARQSNLSSGGGSRATSENKVEGYLRELVELARADAAKETLEVEPAGLV